MKLSPFFVAAALLSMQDYPNDQVPDALMPPARIQDRGALRPGQAEPPSTPVDLGDIAPDFSYQAADGRWQHLHDLVLHGPTLLVFGANEPVLRAIEHDRDRLLDMGVVPVAVMDARSGAARALVQRLGLKFTVLSDSRGVIASQFNAIDPRSGRQVQSLFVLDRARRVRGLVRASLPVRGYAGLAANALGLPEPGASVPAGR